MSGIDPEIDFARKLHEVKIRWVRQGVTFLWIGKIASIVGIALLILSAIGVSRIPLALLGLVILFLGVELTIVVRNSLRAQIR